MNDEQKKFVEERLIPFILREQGNGFAMQVWQCNFKDVGEELGVEKIKDGFVFDGVFHQKPVCDTVCCIGGSIEMLTGCRNELTIAKDILGLKLDQVNAIFYGWQGKGENCWPEKFVKLYQSAQTSLEKANVAVELLKEVVKTNGNCMVTGW